MIKFMVAPAKMPDELTWFKWEAYATWLSGFALLVLVYYFNADLFLIDKSVLDMSAQQAAASRLPQPGWPPGSAMRRCAARRSASTRWRWRSSAMCSWWR